jgi:hypothetical protein
MGWDESGENEMREIVETEISLSESDKMDRIK